MTDPDDKGEAGGASGVTNSVLEDTADEALGKALGGWLSRPTTARSSRSSDWRWH